MWAAYMRSDKGRLLLCWAGALASAALGVAGGLLIGAALIRGGQGTLLALYALNAVQQVFTFALPALLILGARTARWQAFRKNCVPLRFPTVSYGALLAVGGAVTASVIAYYWALWLRSVTGYAGGGDPLPVPQSPGQWALALLAIAIVPALCEELFFRGLVQSALCRYLPRAGLWIAAGVFALVHGRWDGLPALLGVGAVLGAVYRRRGYWGSAALHALYNGVVLVLSAREIGVTPGMLLLCGAACLIGLKELLKKETEDETDRSGL